MKIRDSGMPAQEQWEQYLDARAVLTRLGCPRVHDDVVDFGCGYGTFSLAAAQLTTGTVHALDIELEMVRTTGERARLCGLTNVIARQRDLVAQGSGLADASIGCALLFNILHHEEPVALLCEAHRNLRRGGVAAIVHWLSDRPTPRGPSADIRPRPEQCAAWAQEAGFEVGGPVVRLLPFHFGVLAHKLA